MRIVIRCSVDPPWELSVMRRLIAAIAGEFRRLRGERRTLSRARVGRRPARVVGEIRVEAGGLRFVSRPGEEPAPGRVWGLDETGSTIRARAGRPRGRVAGSRDRLRRVHGARARPGDAGPRSAVHAPAAFVAGT